MIRFDLVNAKDIFPEGNNGFDFGLYVFSEANHLLDVDWFKSKQEQLEALERKNKIYV